ncbi:MAG: hypothetical protein V1689_13005 [Pseudomonadota bacterium]
MSDKETYDQFVDWLGKAWWELPDSKELMPHGRHTAQIFGRSLQTRSVKPPR